MCEQSSAIHVSHDYHISGSPQAHNDTSPFQYHELKSIFPVLELYVRSPALAMRMTGMPFYRPLQDYGPLRMVSTKGEKNTVKF